MSMDQYLKHGLDNFKIESFQSAGALQQPLLRLDFGLGDDCWITDHLHILRTSYHRDCWNVYISFWNISHLRSTFIWNLWELETQQAIDHTARWTRVIGGGRRKITFLPEQQFCQLFVYLARPTWLSFQVTSMPARCHLRLVTSENCSAAHLKCSPRSWLCRFLVLWMVPKILTRHDIMRLKQCSPNSEILT